MNPFFTEKKKNLKMSIYGVSDSLLRLHLHKPY